MHRPSIAFWASCLLLVGCASTPAQPQGSTPTRTVIPRPLVEREIAALLLSPGQLASAMRAPKLVVNGRRTSMSDNSATMAPRHCLAIDGAAEAAVYAHHDVRAEREESFTNGDRFTFYVKQAVVLFPTPEKAAQLFEESAREWPNCHRYTHTTSRTRWSVGSVAVTNDILSAVTEQDDAGRPGWRCGRAMARRNNVVVDVNSCSAFPGDAAVRIADQISERVVARW